MARDHLINAAAKFLASPQIKEHPDEKKRNFLHKKGLTNDEVLAAFAKSRMGHTESPPDVDYNQLLDKCFEDCPRNKPIPGGERPSAPFLVIATVTTFSAALVVYLYRLFRRYIWPWVVEQWRQWMGKPKDPPFPPSEELKDIVTSQMYELESTVYSLKDIVHKQQSDIQALIKHDPEEVGVTNEMHSVRQELDSVKRMLLSREQFPAPPSTALPAWQIRRNDNALPSCSNALPSCSNALPTCSASGVVASSSGVVAHSNDTASTSNNSNSVAEVSPGNIHLSPASSTESYTMVTPPESEQALTISESEPLQHSEQLDEETSEEEEEGEEETEEEEDIEEEIDNADNAVLYSQCHKAELDT